MSVFSDRLVRLRKAAKITQSEAVKRIGVSKSMMANYEKGDFLPNGKTLIKMADFYGVSVDYLLGRTGKKEINR